MREIRIRLFGAFRKYTDRGEICLNMPADATVADLRAELARKLREEVPAFGDSGLIDESVFATDVGLLSESDLLEGMNGLAVLPPVCGG